jgi:hypothetical protein
MDDYSPNEKFKKTLLKFAKLIFNSETLNGMYFRLMLIKLIIFL